MTNYNNNYRYLTYILVRLNKLNLNLSRPVFSADVLYLEYETTPIAEIITMRATTTKSSIKVNPWL